MLNTIDLFVGCGGLSEGFEQSRKYKMIGAVEWEPSPVKELRNHLKNRWGINDAEERVLQFDIQRTEELFNGWEDEKFGRSKGLDALVGSQQLDVIIGGPPCQAYSVAGRIRDEHGMREDYRNYLFVFLFILHMIRNLLQCMEMQIKYGFKIMMASTGNLRK